VHRCIRRCIEEGVEVVVGEADTGLGGDANVAARSQVQEVVADGEEFPVTTRGRFFGEVIIVLGVGIFGTFSGYLANLFLSPSKRRIDQKTPADVDVDVRSRVAELREMIDRQQAEQHVAVEEIERVLNSGDP
jgi:hypothetical protein